MKKELKDRYEAVIMEYISLFCKKQGIDFEFWIGGVVGETADFGCLFFNFTDIKIDIDTEQQKGLIIDWFINRVNCNKNNINYKSYTMGLRYRDLNKRECPTHE